MTVWFLLNEFARGLAKLRVQRRTCRGGGNGLSDLGLKSDALLHLATLPTVRFDHRARDVAENGGDPDPTAEQHRTTAEPEQALAVLLDPACLIGCEAVDVIESGMRVGLALSAQVWIATTPDA